MILKLNVSHTGHTQPMQKQVESNKHTVKNCTFMSTVWILEFINRIPLNFILLLRKEKRHGKNLKARWKRAKEMEKKKDENEVRRGKISLERSSLKFLIISVIIVNSLYKMETPLWTCVFFMLDSF